MTQIEKNRIIENDSTERQLEPEVSVTAASQENSEAPVGGNVVELPRRNTGLSEGLPEGFSLAAALDGLLFVHNRPLTFERLSELLNRPREEIESLVLQRKKVFDDDPDRGLQIIINEEGVQVATKAAISLVIQRLEGQKLVSLSLPALETLSVIAFKQPITKAEIEAIRGVNCDGVISTLLEKKLIFVSGEKPVIGRPRLYSTTQDFLYYFGMKSLRELPVPIVEVPENIEIPASPAVDDPRHVGTIESAGAPDTGSSAQSGDQAAALPIPAVETGEMPK